MVVFCCPWYQQESPWLCRNNVNWGQMEEDPMVQSEGHKFYPMELCPPASQQSTGYGTTMCNTQRVEGPPSNSDLMHLDEVQWHCSESGETPAYISKLNFNFKVLTKAFSGSPFPPKSRSTSSTHFREPQCPTAVSEPTHTSPAMLSKVPQEHRCPPNSLWS